MKLAAALVAIERGQAVSREAWRDPDKIVRSLQKASDVLWGEPAAFAIAQGPQVFTRDDLDADDWFVVAAIH